MSRYGIDAENNKLIMSPSEVEIATQRRAKARDIIFDMQETLSPGKSRTSKAVYDFTWAAFHNDEMMDLFLENDLDVQYEELVRARSTSPRSFCTRGRGSASLACQGEAPTTARHHTPSPVLPTTEKKQRCPDLSGGDIAILPPTPPLLVAPTIPNLRMLLGVLKHKPAGVVKDVGVLLMLLASAIEVTDFSIPMPVGSGNADGGGSSRDTWAQMHSRNQREARVQLERQTEATKILDLARRASTGIKGSSNGTSSGQMVAKTKKKRHQLREVSKVEDKLQAWAAKRGRNVSELKTLLGCSNHVATADARLVRDRVVLIPAGCAAKALSDAGIVLDFISKAVNAVVDESATNSTVGRKRLSHIDGEGHARNCTVKCDVTPEDRPSPPGPSNDAAAKKPDSKRIARPRDKMGDIPLVTPDGEYNAWDAILEAQLSKCPPLPDRQQAAPVATIDRDAFFVTKNKQEPFHAVGGDGSDSNGAVNRTEHGLVTAHERRSSTIARPANDVASAQPLSPPMDQHRPRSSDVGTPSGAEKVPRSGLRTLDSALTEKECGSTNSRLPVPDVRSVAVAAAQADLVPAITFADRAPFPSASPRPLAEADTTYGNADLSRTGSKDFPCKQEKSKSERKQDSETQKNEGQEESDILQDNDDVVVGKVVDILYRSKRRDELGFPALASKVKNAIDNMLEEPGSAADTSKLPSSSINTAQSTAGGWPVSLVCTTATTTSTSTNTSTSINAGSRGSFVEDPSGLSRMPWQAGTTTVTAPLSASAVCGASTAAYGLSTEECESRAPGRCDLSSIGIDNVTAWDWATIGGVGLRGTGGMGLDCVWPLRSLGGRGGARDAETDGVRVTKGAEAGLEGESGQDASVSHLRHGRMGPSSTMGHMRGGALWGVTVSESHLHNEWYAEQDERLVGGSLSRFCGHMQRKEWKRRAPEREEERRRQLQKRAKNGGLSPRQGLGKAWRTRRNLPRPPSASTPYQLSDQLATMTERWPGALLRNCKALMTELPRLEEYGRGAFEAVFEGSVRRELVGLFR